MRALRTRGVFAVGCNAVDRILKIGILAIQAPIGIARLKDIDSEKTYTVDLSLCATGTHFKVELEWQAED
jgi:hypothetical protein